MHSPSRPSQSGFWAPAKKDNGPETSKLPKGALSGEFTVNAEGKKVYFSKGNLYADGSNALHFEANQDSYADIWDASHISHFTWSSTVADAVSISNGGNNLFCDENHKVSVDGSEAIYYNLTKDEWNYLLNFRTVNGGTGREYSYVGWVTYRDKTGMILYPDNYDGPRYHLGNTLDSLPEGVVFLPATGERKETTVAHVDDINYLNYWTSSIHEVHGDYSHTIIFDFSFIMPGATRHYVGLSVRLVTDAN